MSTSPLAPRKRLLIIDDAPDSLALLYDFLTPQGFAVFVADSGRLALEELPRIRPDLILLDILMPGLDGFETCRRIKQTEDFADVPLFFLTVLSETVDKVKGFSLGAADFITKPFEQEEVLARIQAHLELRALRQAVEERNEELDREVQRRIAAEDSLENALETPVLIADRAGTVHFSTQAAQRLLARHGGLPSPEKLRLWVDARSPVSHGKLQVRSNTDPDAPDRILLSLSETAPTPSPEALACLGLTPRETEILFWIAQGKTSPEIAIILNTAPATVKRHVYNLLPKLGVETRLAAALKAMELLNRTGPAPQIRSE